jgi:DNA-binding beta-propeller fold protein YncE
VAFDPSGEMIVAVFDSTQLRFMVFNKDVSSIYYFEDSNSRTSSSKPIGGGVLMSSTGQVYLATSGSGSNWMVLSVNYNSHALVWAQYAVSSFGYANDLTFGRDETYVYVGGNMKVSSSDST